eukprot:scaffold111_cov149-Amphora_coffeaeformis.AAC.8
MRSKSTNTNAWFCHTIDSTPTKNAGVTEICDCEYPYVLKPNHALASIYRRILSLRQCANRGHPKGSSPFLSNNINEHRTTIDWEAAQF